MRNGTLAAIALLVALVPAAPSAADDPAATKKNPKTDAEEVGTQTRRWLELQRSGLASAPPRGLPAEAIRRSQERLLDSFSHPIPEELEPHERRRR
jgi:hypothetical protein